MNDENDKDELQLLTMVIGEGLREVAEAVNQLTRSVRSFYDGSYIGPLPGDDADELTDPRERS